MFCAIIGKLLRSYIENALGDRRRPRCKQPNFFVSIVFRKVHLFRINFFKSSSFTRGASVTGLLTLRGLLNRELESTGEIFHLSSVRLEGNTRTPLRANRNREFMTF